MEPCSPAHSSIGATVPLLNWNVIEANVTILCASLIASRPVAMFLVPDRLISSMKSYIARFSGSQRIRLATETPVLPNQYPFERRSRLQHARSFKLQGYASSMQGYETMATQEATDTMELNDLQPLTIPQPAQLRSHS